MSESLSHVCGRCSCRGGGGAGLGAIIWEDAVPCPAGAVVSPLKKPAPHCSRAAAAGSRRRPRGAGRKGRRRRHPATTARAQPAGRPRSLAPRRESGSSRRASEGRRSERAGAGIDSEDSCSLAARLSAVFGPPVSGLSDPGTHFPDSQPRTASYSETRTSRSLSYTDQEAPARTDHSFFTYLFCMYYLSVKWLFLLPVLYETPFQRIPVPAVKDQPMTHFIFCPPFMDLLQRVQHWVRSLKYCS